LKIRIKGRIQTFLIRPPSQKHVLKMINMVDSSKRISNKYRYHISKTEIYTETSRFLQHIESLNESRKFAVDSYIELLYKSRKFAVD
jgi:hypothetical protein